MKSYITVSMFGSHIEEFMNEIIQKSIRVWNIKNNEGIIFFDTSPRKYKKIAQAALDYRIRTKIEGRYGAYFKLRGYKKRYGAFFGIVSFFGIVVLFSNFIWDIRVSGNETVSAAQITEVLNKQGIKSGAYIRSCDFANAELAATLELDKLAWISIERDGSRINVKVSERLEAEEDEIPITSPCNVIAEKSGLVVETEVYRGRLLVEKGWGVEQGDVIVSGVAEDGIGNVFLNHADAKIIAECVDEADFFLPFITRERKNNGIVTKNSFIIFLGKTFPLFINSSPVENAVYSEEMRAPTFFGFKLPYRIKTCVYKYYDMVEVQNSQTDTLAQLKKQIELYKENFFGGSEIISCDETYIPNEDGIEAKIKITYRTNIAKKKIIGTP